MRRTRAKHFFQFPDLIFQGAHALLQIVHEQKRFYFDSQSTIMPTGNQTRRLNALKGTLAAKALFVVGIGLQNGILDNAVNCLLEDFLNLFQAPLLGLGQALLLAKLFPILFAQHGTRLLGQDGCLGLLKTAMLARGLGSDGGLADVASATHYYLSVLVEKV
jgi:hypothetical protein